MAELEGKQIAYFEDLDVPKDPTKPATGDNWTGTYDRIIHFVDGTTKTYRYSVKDHPENAENNPDVVIPKGATFIESGIDEKETELIQRRQELEFQRQRAATQDASQRSTEAANRAAQTGEVTTVDESGNLVGTGQPTLAARAEERQSATAQAQAEAARASAAASMANVDVNREQNRITQERNEAQALYEQKQLEAQKERDRINGLVAIGTLDATKAQNEFQQWLEVNVKIPFMQMEEARDRATELREAQKLEDLRRQNAAQFQQNREVTAIGAGNQAMDAAVATLPYMAGPKWGEQFAGALNAIGEGRPEDINFTAEGLTFDSPDFANIARQATAIALSQLSPYAAAIAGAGERPGGGYAQGNYEGIPTPATVPGTPAVLNQVPYSPTVSPVTPTTAPIGGQEEMWQ